MQMQYIIELKLRHSQFSLDPFRYSLLLFNETRTPPVEAALVVTYLQFPIQVRFRCTGQPVTDTRPTITGQPATRTSVTH